MKASGANGWRERRGQAERERGLATLCESGRERWAGRAKRVLVGAGTLARASHGGGHANLFAERPCGCCVSAPHLIAVALLLGKGLALLLQAKLLGAISTAFLFILSVSGSAFNF